MSDINTDQTFPNAFLTITKNDGSPGSVDGIPVWASSDETVLAVRPAADGMTAVVGPVAAGTARITVTADADLGAGVITITGISKDVEVSTGPLSLATTIVIDLGTPVDKTA